LGLEHTVDILQKIVDHIHFPPFDGPRAINRFEGTSNKSNLIGGAVLRSSYQVLDDLFLSRDFIDWKRSGRSWEWSPLSTIPRYF
jgi:hypothetical protein